MFLHLFFLFVWFNGALHLASLHKALSQHPSNLNLQTLILFVNSQCVFDGKIYTYIYFNLISLNAKCFMIKHFASSMKRWALSDDCACRWLSHWILMQRQRIFWLSSHVVFVYESTALPRIWWRRASTLGARLIISVAQAAFSYALSRLDSHVHRCGWVLMRVCHPGIGAEMLTPPRLEKDRPCCWII